MSIRPLPDHAVGQIRSAAAVTSLNGVACGLLRNALDARCTRANIRLDYGRGNCTVEDDGLGIEPCEFRPDGGLARLHHTSRTPPSPAVHGRRGDFLASVASLALLSVTSHHHGYLSQSSLSIHNSDVLARRLPAPPELRLQTFDHGTRVSVRDLFGAMPVRVKHRATVFSDRSGIDREWGHLVRELVALLLAWPSDVSVSLSETAVHRQLRLKSMACTDIVARTSRLFAQASLADSIDAPSWMPVSASARRIRIKGCISTNPVATRRSQMLSLGIQPILNSQDCNVLYEAINKVFTNSSFGRIEAEEAHPTGGDAGPKAKSRKGLERWPMFYLQVLLPSADMLAVDDFLNDSRGLLATVLELLKAVCYDFLKKQCFRPRAVEKPAGMALRLAPRISSAGRSPLSTEPKMGRPSSRGPVADAGLIRTESPFDGWHRAKIGWAAPQGRQAKPMGHGRWSGKPQTDDKHRLVGAGGKLLCKPFSDAATSGADVGHSGHENETGEGGLDAASDTEARLADLAAEATRLPKRRRVLKRRPKPRPSKWFQGVVASWQNPVFETAQAPVSQLYDDDAPTADGAHQGRDGGREVNFEAGSTSLVARVSRAALTDAEVIAQVDRKFILVKLPLEPTTEADDAKASSALVMLDQHAADERCRLEGLLASYFAERSSTGLVEPVVEALERPVVFEASDKEGELLERYREHFASWGVLYQVRTEAHGDAACNVKVTSLPPSILERCRSEPRVLIDLVRRELWALADGNTTACARNRRPGPAKSLAARFHGCPSGILELLHSRSCRSAIMFNDELSRDECAQLVQKLARCVFPFQCAHGRPSMVPLADLGSGTGRIGGRRRAERPVGVDGWKRWMDEGDDGVSDDG